MALFPNGWRGAVKTLLDIRWVCVVCLKVIHVPLKITERWVGNKTKTWQIITATGPRCHGQDMLLAGEPKVDRFGLSGQGRGALVDPVDTLRIKVAV